MVVENHFELDKDLWKLQPLRQEFKNQPEIACFEGHFRGAQVHNGKTAQQGNHRRQNILV
jgi:hypothetical protein